MYSTKRNIIIFFSIVFILNTVKADTLNLIILGNPGSGKGTISQLLKKEFGYFHLSTGDLLREECKNKTIVGSEISQFFSKKQLVPDRLVIQLLENRLSYLVKNHKSFIIDGFPFNEKQLNYLHDTLTKFDSASNVAVILLKVDDEVVTQRILKRKICENCNQIYNEKYFPSSKKDVCSICGAKLFARKEDNVPDIKLRLTWYKDNLNKLIPQIKEKFTIYEITSNLDLLKCIKNQDKHYIRDCLVTLDKRL